MDDFQLKSAYFATALIDMYKDEEEKESTQFKLEFSEDELTEDFTAMVYAQWALYRKITGDDVDIIGFTHLLNRLVVQQVIKDKTD